MKKQSCRSNKNQHLQWKEILSLLKSIISILVLPTEFGIPTASIHFRVGLTFISHVAVDLGPGVPLSEVHPLHVALKRLVDDLIQRLVLQRRQEHATHHS